MSVAESKTESLKADIAVARKRPLAFGLCLGKSPETTVLVTHKSKDPETLGRQAKKEGETNKIAFGMMSVEGKDINLACQADPPPGLARKTREMLKAAGMKLKVRLLDAEGNVLEEDGDEEEGEDGAEGTEAAGGGDATQEEAAAALAGEDGKEDPAKGRWDETSKKLGPQVEALREVRTPEARKLQAFWSFAQSKVTADPPDFAGAVKAAAMVSKMLETMAPPADAPAPGGAAAPGSAAPETAAPAGTAPDTAAQGGTGADGAAPGAVSFDDRAAERARRTRARTLDLLEAELFRLNSAFN